jgi:hypothetical protein
MLFRAAWNCMKRFSCYVELHETAWIFFMLHGTAWNCMKTVSCCMELHEAAWNCMKPHENHGHQLPSKKTCCAHADASSLKARLAVPFSFISNLIMDRF